MADTDYVINLVANIKDSLKNVENLSKSVDKEVSQIRNSFSGIANFATGALAAIGVGFSLKAAISEASQYEQAVRGLEIALESSGLNAQTATSNFVEYASALQQTTKFSDDAVLSTASLIQSIARLPTDQLKQATKASLDLATALRIDVDTAARLVSKAAEGNVEVFKRYGIEIKKGKTDAESFANALATLNSRFGGAAEKSVDTYAGATAQLTNNALDALKAFGLLIIQNRPLIDAIKATSDRFAELAVSIEKNEGPISKIINGTVFLVDLLRKMTLGFSSKEFEDLFPPQTIDTIDQAIAGAKNYRKTLEETRQNQQLVLGKQADEARVKLVADTDKSLQAVRTGLVNAGKSQIAILLDNRNDQLKVISDGQKLGLVPIQEANKLRLASQAKFESEMDKVLVAARKTKLAAEKEAEAQLLAQRQKIGGLVSGLVGSIGQGAQGVAGALSGVTGMLVDTVLPGLGGAAAQLLQFLAQGPEAVKAQIQGFIDNIPVIIDAIILSIPAVIEALVANAPKIALSLSNQMPFVATRLSFELIKSTPQIAKGFVNGLISEAGRLIQAIVDGIKGAISQATGLGGGGGITSGITGAVGGIRKKLGFSEGGVIPSGFPNDSFPMPFAQSGEGVVPVDTMRRLSEFLTEGGGGSRGGSAGAPQMMTVHLVIGQNQLASAIVDLRRRGFDLGLT